MKQIYGIPCIGVWYTVYKNNISSKQRRYPEWAIPALKTIIVADAWGEGMHPRGGSSSGPVTMWDLCKGCYEIYPGSKLAHFKAIKSKMGVGAYYLLTYLAIHLWCLTSTDPHCDTLALLRIAAIPSVGTRQKSVVPLYCLIAVPVPPACSQAMRIWYSMTTRIGI